MIELIFLIFNIFAKIRGENYHIIKNHGIDFDDEINRSLIMSSNELTEIFCLTKCNLNPSCLSVLYYNNRLADNCKQFKELFNSFDKKTSIDSNLYEKKVAKLDVTQVVISKIPITSIKSGSIVVSSTTLLFNQNSTEKLNSTVSINTYLSGTLNGSYFLEKLIDETMKVNFSINGYYIPTFVAFSGLNGILNDMNSMNYVIDKNLGQVIIFDKDWKYFSNKSYENPTYMIEIETFLYLSSKDFIFKMDNNLSYIEAYNHSSSDYHEMFYNKTNNSIYCAASNRNSIDVLDLNLTILDSYNTNPYQPYSMKEYNSQLYVGTLESFILVIENKVIIKKFNGCNNTTYTRISSLIIIQDSYLSTLCFANNAMYLYFINGTYANISMITNPSPTDIKFDLYGRLMIVSYNSITIYN